MTTLKIIQGAAIELGEVLLFLNFEFDLRKDECRSKEAKPCLTKNKNSQQQ